MARPTLKKHPSQCATNWVMTPTCGRTWKTRAPNHATLSRQSIPIAVTRRRRTQRSIYSTFYIGFLAIAFLTRNLDCCLPSHNPTLQFSIVGFFCFAFFTRLPILTTVSVPVHHPPACVVVSSDICISFAATWKAKSSDQRASERARLEKIGATLVATKDVKKWHRQRLHILKQLVQAHDEL
jgi:hypothetical protein